MAKKKAAKKSASKKSPAGKPDRVPRKEPYSAADLNGVVSRLRTQAARLTGLAKAIADAKVEKIVVDGHAMLLRGLNQVDNFTDNAARSAREAGAKNGRG